MPLSCYHRPLGYATLVSIILAIGVSHYQQVEAAACVSINQIASGMRWTAMLDEPKTGGFEFSTFGAAIQAVPKLEARLNAKKNNLTVFIPTDEAFEAALDELGFSSTDELLSSPNLEDILSFHVVPGRWRVGQAECEWCNDNDHSLYEGRPLRTITDVMKNKKNLETLLDGEVLPVSAQNKILQVNGVDITGEANIHMRNGVAHAVDQLFIPPSLKTRRRGSK